MRALTADDIIRVWESGHRQSPAERAVTLLAAALPEKRAEELRSLSVGARNAQLLSVRVGLFGSELAAFSECPACGEALELTLNADVLRGVRPQTDADGALELEAEGYVVRFRLLDSNDLTAAAGAADVKAARDVLIARLVVEARRENDVVHVADLPDVVVDRLAARLAESDPHADVLIDLVCPACGCSWQVPFDIASFCDAEIGAQARRLLREVHALARAYAWREADILAMSARRRQYYLDMLVQ